MVQERAKMDKAFATVPAPERKSIYQQIALAEKSRRISLSIRNDHTFTISATDAGHPHGKPQDGTWSQTGNEISLMLKVSPRGKKPFTDTQKCTIVDGGKRLKMPIQFGYVNFVRK
ncbi:MAG: hypothetical protein JSS72_08300 [Armatimonadetes bacterium]|nr:hypothetical protein [Armatimonadota bacterium]